MPLSIPLCARLPLNLTLRPILINSATMTKSFTIRDWCGVAVGVLCALIPLLIFKSGDMTPFWTVVLLGPPLVFLVAPKRPILAWQVPMITAAVFTALTSREPWEPRYSKGQLGVALLVWVMCSLLSLPWAIVFAHRTERAREQPNTKPSTPGSYVGLGLLVFLACALVILGLILSFLMQDSTDPRDSAAPFESFLMVTLGVGIALAACRIAAKLGASKGVEHVLGLAFSYFGIPGFIGLIFTLWEKPKSATRLPSAGTFWFGVDVLEIVAVLVWLLARGRQTRQSSVTARNPE